MSFGSAIGAANFTAFGTSASLLVTDPSCTDRARTLLDAELAAIDRACSRFRPDAELRRVNHARGRPVRGGEIVTAAGWPADTTGKGSHS